MKHLALLLLPSVAICSAMASNHKTEFNDNLANGRYEQADSVLAAWETEHPQDPELFAARYNYMLNSSRQSTLVLSNETPDGEALILTDSTGNTAGAIFGQSTWNDSLLNLAFSEIDRGIAAFPDRIDFRLGKAAGAELSEKWDTVFTTFNSLLDRSLQNGLAWYGEDNAPLDSLAKEIVIDASLRYIGGLHEQNSAITDSMAIVLCNKAVELMPEEYKIVNLAGAVHYGARITDKAVQYFLRAKDLNHDDPMAIGNLAYIYYRNGENDKAVELYLELLNNPVFDDETHEFASQMIERINTPATPLRIYDYFFRWLPEIAQYITTDNAGALLSTPELVNGELMKENQLSSPFADDQISIDTLSYDGKTIYIWQFPEPEECPNCLYVAFVPAANGSKVFTLEKSIFADFMVGSQQEGSHISFFDTDRPENAEAFARMLIDRGIIGQE